MLCMLGISHIICMPYCYREENWPSRPQPPIASEQRRQVLLQLVLKPPPWLPREQRTLRDHSKPSTPTADAPCHLEHQRLARCNQKRFWRPSDTAGILKSRYRVKHCSQGPPAKPYRGTVDLNLALQTSCAFKRLNSHEQNLTETLL